MSIIHDALKKVQQDKTPPAAVSAPQQRPGLPWLIIEAIVLFAIISGIAVFMLSRNSTPLKATLQANALAAPVPEPQTAVQPSAPLTPQGPAPQATGEIRIEGVMDMGDRKIALINGNIYEIGQKIHGKTIKEITLEYVILTEGVDERTLPVGPENNQ